MKNSMMQMFRKGEDAEGNSMLQIFRKADDAEGNSMMQIFRKGDDPEANSILQRFRKGDDAEGNSVMQVFRKSDDAEGNFNGTGSNVVKHVKKKDNAQKNMVQDAQDIPREELLHLSMKLSKRLKVVESRMQTLAEAHKQVLAEKDGLIASVRQVTGPIWEESTDGGEQRVVPTEPVEGKDAGQEGTEVGKTKQTDAERATKALEAFEASLRAQAIFAAEKQKEEMKKAKNDMQQLQANHRKELLALEARLKDLSSSAKAPSPSLQETEEGGELLDEPIEHDPLPSAAAITLMQQQLLDLEAQLATAHADNMELNTEVEKAKSDCAEKSISINGLKGQCTKLEEENKQLKVKLEEIQVKEAEMRSKSEEKIVYLKLQLDKLKQAKEELLSKNEEAQTFQKESEESKIRISGLEDQLSFATTHLEEHRLKVTEMEESLVSYQLLQVEKDSVIENIRATLAEELTKGRDMATKLEAAENKAEELSTVQDELQSANSKLQEKDELEAKARGEVGELRQQLASVQAMVTRLKDEANSATNTHAARAALVATVQQEVATLQSQLKFQAQKLEEKEEAFQKTQHANLMLEGKLQEQSQSIEQLRQEHQAEGERIKISHKKEMDNLKKHFEGETLKINADYKKKSSLARQLLAEKDAQSRKLETQVNELQAEIDSGGHSERKIIQLAQTQAARLSEESKLQSALQEKIEELNSFKQKYERLSNQVSDLQRDHRRSNVNIEYLKNVVVNYMSLNSSCTAKKSLVPVISMLLQFSPREMELVQSAHETWWSWPSSENVKTITRRPSSNK